MTTYRFAGFWRRFVAYMIDQVIISLVFIVLMIIAAIAFFVGAMSGDSQAWITRLADPERIDSIMIWVWLFSFGLSIAYFTYFHGATGRTPGKMLLGLQVVSADGTPISFGVAFLRSVGYLLSSIVFCLGYIWIGFDKKKQGWHDKIAGTVVIIRDPQESVAGINISDSAPGETSGSLTDRPGNEMQTTAQRPEMLSAEGQDSQKIP